MIRAFDTSWALEAAACWIPGITEAPALVAHSANSVYRVRRAHGEPPIILRITDPSYRSQAACEAELTFISHAISSKVAAAPPLLSEAGTHVVALARNQERAVASAFQVAPGALAQPGTPAFGPLVCEAWGRCMALLHQAARSAPGAIGGGSLRWDEDVFLTQGPSHFDPEDLGAYDELDQVLSHLDGLDRGPERFGLCHGDLGPQNFHWHPVHGLTVFDFGNLSYHWFAMDLAVAATTLRSLAPQARQEAWRGILRGYRRVQPPPPGWEDDFPWMLRLRMLYVWLSRLWKFGENPTGEERRTLEHLRNRVGQPF